MPFLPKTSTNETSSTIKNRCPNNLNNLSQCIMYSAINNLLRNVNGSSPALQWPGVLSCFMVFLLKRKPGCIQNQED